MRQITGAEKTIADAFLKARGEALKALSPEQRAQLDQLRAERRPVTEDKYRQLLLLPLDEIWQVPIDPETARALLDAGAFAARSPRQYPYLGAGFGFTSYGYGYGGRFFLFYRYDRGVGFWFDRQPGGRGQLGARIPRPRGGNLPGSLSSGASRTRGGPR